MKRRKCTVIVAGMLAGVPYQGGWAWALLQYLLGLKLLGHDVYFVETVNREKLIPSGATLTKSRNAAYFMEVTAQFGLERNSMLTVSGGESIGMTHDELSKVSRRAGVLLNISGACTDAGIFEHVPCRVYIDLDPAFTQLWHMVDGVDMRFAGHTHFVTVGQAVGRPECGVPMCGLDWITMMPPIVLKYWPMASPASMDACTTVANWRGYGSVCSGAVFHGQKAHSFREFMKLPTRTEQKFLLALAIHPNESSDLAALNHHRWGLVDPSKVARTPERYQRFVQRSKAEFGIAKSGYVASQCGWFSDRSACYLASGRPVIAQETGFSRFLPQGKGLFAFETERDVLAAVDAIRSDYARHSRAARAIAEEFFDSGKVLFRLLDGIGAAA